MKSYTWISNHDEELHITCDGSPVHGREFWYNPALARYAIGNMPVDVKVCRNCLEWLNEWFISED